MRVREILAQESAHITDKQIQETLWHYYYDVDKSVSYLRKEYIVKPKVEQKKVPGRSPFISISYTWEMGLAGSKQGWRWVFISLYTGYSRSRRLLISTFSGVFESVRKAVLVLGILQRHTMVQYSCRTTGCLHCPFIPSRWSSGWFVGWSSESVEIAGSSGCSEKEGSGTEIQWGVGGRETDGRTLPGGPSK